MTGPIDVVVANLPYLPAAELDSHPDLAGEPAGAVFAGGDGLGPYRRLLTACADRLEDDAAVIIQLRRRVLVAEVADLAALGGRIERTVLQPSLLAA